MKERDEEWARELDREEKRKKESDRERMKEEGGSRAGITLVFLRCLLFFFFWAQWSQTFYFQIQVSKPISQAIHQTIGGGRGGERHTAAFINFGRNGGIVGSACGRRLSDGKSSQTPC